MNKRSYKEAKRKALYFYKQWCKEETYSPAIKEQILVTKEGWDHLLKSNRSHKDIRNRINLLKSARELILISTTLQDISWRKNNRYYILEAVREVAYDTTKELKIIRVVLKENKSHQLIFFSVMDNNIGERK